MQITVTDDPARHRYEARVGAELAAFAAYRPSAEFLTFIHTEVLAGFEGIGVASTLVRRALDDVRARHLSVVAVCPFVAGFIDRHRADYGDLLYRSPTGTVRD